MNSDELDRLRISTGVDKRCVVVAGAGSGKTRHLVERVANTIAGGVATRNVAVITFTEKAARELVNRLRQRGIDGLDDAYIGTIHGFCASILRRYPIEAGLPPAFTTTDEITSRAEAADRRRTIVRQVYDAAADDEALLEALAIVASTVGLGRLSTVVDVIDSQWHRFIGIDLTPAPVGQLAPLVERYLADFDQFVRTVKQHDRVVTATSRIAEWRARPLTLRSIADFDEVTFGNIGGAQVAELRKSLRQSWLDIQRGANTIVLRRIVSAFRDPVVDHAAGRISRGQLGYDDLLILTQRLLAGSPAITAELSQRFQRVFVDEFQDTDAVQFDIISMITRGPPEESPTSPRLFAVGDPKQSIYAFRSADVELFGGLADDAERTGALAKLTSNFRSRQPLASWINSVMERRFVAPMLTDKKRDELDKAGLWPLPVTVPYEPLVAQRPAQATDAVDSGPAVVLLGVTEDGNAELHATVALAQQAEAADIVGIVERVTNEQWRVLKPGNPNADDAPVSWNSRVAKRRDIAVLVAKRTGLATLETALRNAGIPYRVEGGTLAYENREVYELLRVLRAVDNPADELLLVTALRSSILGCSDADLFAYRHRQPHGYKGSWRLPPQSAPDSVPPALDLSESAGIARVLAGLSQIAAWSSTAHQLSPAMLLTNIFDWSMGAATAQYEGAHARVETWRRARYLIDEARAWTDETGGTLHEYLGWIADKIDAVDRAEIAPDETDEDSVRILTIHAAKGLEFPIVIAAALGTKDNNLEDTFKVAFVDDVAELKFGSMKSSGYPDRDDAARWAEEARLLYVAMTRAHDHLIVSCHTSSRSTPNPASRVVPLFDLTTAQRWSAERSEELTLPFLLTQLQLVEESQPVTVDELAERPSKDRRTVWTPSGLAARQRDHPVAAGPSPESDASVESHRDAPAPIEGSHLETRNESDDGLFEDQPFEAGGGAVLRDSGDADNVEPGIRKDPPSGREVLRSRGRYGTDIGIAVHEVMQTVNLADPADGLEDLIAVACDNVDLVGPARLRVERLVRSIISTPLFAEMAAAPLCEREVYVGTLVGEADEPISLWGYIDAIFQLPDGSYAVVDFKTDSAAASPEELAERYAVQLNAYGVAVERATGATVGQLWLLVAKADGLAVEVPIARHTPEWPSWRPPDVGAAADVRVDCNAAHRSAVPDVSGSVLVTASDAAGATTEPVGAPLTHQGSLF